MNNLILPCIRMIEMTHELHRLGYQKIRIFPSMAPSGCHWRLAWAPDFAFPSPVSPPQSENEYESVCYSSGAGWQPFGWQNVQPLSALEMAQKFLQQFPALASAGKGYDQPYAEWLTRLLSEVREGRLPWFQADWPVDFTQGIPLSEGGQFPLPPQVITSGKIPGTD